MVYRISRHAQQQMTLRGISAQSVDAVLQAPGQVVAEQGGRKCYQSQFNSRGKAFLLRVIVAEDVTPDLVVTVYFTSQIDRYWVQDAGDGEEGTP